MGWDAFETATRQGSASQAFPTGTLARYRPQVAVSVLVVVVLVGGAFYASRVSERAPQVVYSASLEEVENEAQDPLRIDINTADVEELDELPEVGPATAETIVEYRRNNGSFRSVEELASVRNCKNTRDHVPHPADPEWPRPDSAGESLGKGPSPAVDRGTAHS
jgi:competence protein ComEA